MILGMLQVTTNSLDFSLAAKEPKTRPCTQRKSRALLRLWIFRLRRKNQKHALVPKEKAVHLFGARLFLCGLYWIRTSDLCPVKAAL
jgi:hypothetical protein